MTKEAEDLIAKLVTEIAQQDPDVVRQAIEAAKLDLRKAVDDAVPIAVGDVVQIDPDHDARFGACFLVVTELKPTWKGLQGYVTVPGGPEQGGQAFYRVEEKHVVRIGRAEWMLADES